MLSDLPGFDDFTNGMSMRSLSFDLYSHYAKQEYLSLEINTIKLLSCYKKQHIENGHSERKIEKHIRLFMKEKLPAELDQGLYVPWK